MQPLGLAPLLQTVSTDVTNSVRRAAFANGEDVIIEATMTSPMYAERLLLSLAKTMYTDLLIVLSDTSRTEAHRRVVDRWWHDRETDPLGGRLIKPETIDAAYNNDNASTCVENATALLNTVRSGTTILEHASLITYVNGELLSSDSYPPRAMP